NGTTTMPTQMAHATRSGDRNACPARTRASGDGDTEKRCLCVSASLWPVINEGCFSCVLESCPEPQLHHPRLIRNVRVRRGRGVSDVALRRHVGSVVRVVEQVEHLEDPVKGSMPCQDKAALHAGVHAMDWMADQRIARHDGPVGTEPPA